MEKNGHKKITVYDIPSYRDLLTLTRKQTTFTPEEITLAHRYLLEFNRQDLADELFDIIRRMPTPQNRHTMLDIARKKLDACVHMDVNNCDASATAFAIILTINSSGYNPLNNLGTHCMPISHLTALNIANLLHARANLSEDTIMIISPALYSAKMLSGMTAHHWSATIKNSLQQSIENPGRPLQIPIHHLPHTKPLIAATDNSAITNKALIGAIIHKTQEDFDRLFIEMTATKAWADGIEAEIESDIDTRPAKHSVGIFPFIYPVRAAINEMANLDREIIKRNRADTVTDTHVFYTYSQWKRRNATALNGKTAQEHAKMFTQHATAWHSGVEASLSANRQAEVLLADVQTMTEYMQACDLNLENESSWAKAQTVIEEIDDPIIETLEESRHPEPNGDHPYASVSPHALESGTVAYAVITISSAQGQRLARYILWNTHTHHAEQAIETAKKLLSQWGVEEVHHYEPTPIAICSCCNEILAYEYDQSGDKTAQHLTGDG